MFFVLIVVGALHHYRITSCCYVHIRLNVKNISTFALYKEWIENMFERKSIVFIRTNQIENLKIPLFKFLKCSKRGKWIPDIISNVKKNTRTMEWRKGWKIHEIRHDMCNLVSIVAAIWPIIMQQFYISCCLMAFFQERFLFTCSPSIHISIIFAWLLLSFPQ